MKVLGLNFSNDAAASMVVDGRTIFAVQEERYSRKKHDASFPQKSLEAALKAGGIPFEDLETVAFFWNPGIHASSPSWRNSSVPRHHMEFLYDVPNNLLPRIGKPEITEQVFHLAGGKKLRIVYVTHHLAHAAGALFTSPFEKAAILTVDGYGERDSTVIWQAEGTSFKRLWTQEFPHSLGSFYAAITQYLGFSPNSGEGKLMGLASYGEPIYANEFRKMLKLTSDGFELDLSYFNFYIERPQRYSDKMVALLGEPRMPESTITKRHEDLAASMQAVFEEAIIHLAKKAKALTGLETFCMSGGVTLNCSANGKLLQTGLFDNYYFQPASSDAGAGLGAALYVTHTLEGVPRGKPELLSEYLGPCHGNAQIKDTLEKGGISYLTPDDPYGIAGALLAKGFIGSVYQGKAEFGPRALGNRSTLADPRGAEMKDRVNARVKFREGFRPFAPSVMAEHAVEYFGPGADFSPFMLRVFPTRPNKLDEAAAVTHVDGGARVQSVTQKDNPNYYHLIDSFRRETGTPLVLNTSFNIRGEPIVNSPADAVKCYLTTDMDFLVLGDYLLVKDSGIL